MPIPQFNEIRTRRLTIGLREISIGNAILTTSIPFNEYERTTTAFLNAVAICDQMPDNKDWTVQERILAVCQYLSAINGEEEPDFKVGSGHYSDYLAAGNDVGLDENKALKTYAIGEIGGDTWKIRHLTGRMAQSIERLQGEVKLSEDHPILGYPHWELGCMAAQMFLEKEPDYPDTEGQYDEWLLHRMIVLLQFPQSAFTTLRQAFHDGRGQLEHLFAIELCDDGIVVMPRGAGSALPPARFCLHPWLSKTTQGLAG